jgi:hypothetical protein
MTLLAIGVENQATNGSCRGQAAQLRIDGKFM